MDEPKTDIVNEPKPDATVWYTHWWNRCGAAFVVPGWDDESKIRCDKRRNHQDRNHATRSSGKISLWVNKWVN